MNNFFSLLLILSIVLCNETKYWSLGVIIKTPIKTKIIQKEIDLNNFVVDVPSKELKNQHPRNIYTLKTNYFIAPKSTKYQNENNQTNGFERTKVTDLILEEEYFEAAKQILYLDRNELILEEFQDWDDFYYWSSFIYFNLGNYSEASNNISKISNKDNNPETLFLEALIYKDMGDIEKAVLILKHIIKEFSENEYSGYARDILDDK
tara:strand:- start:626 stop:1246 length:621 start_codon:yes stop_codon:yes gene_type:complete